MNNEPEAPIEQRGQLVEEIKQHSTRQTKLNEYFKSTRT